MLEFHRVTRCPTWAAEASPCAGTSMPCNPIVPEVPFGGELLSVISPLLPLGEVDDEGLCRSTMPISMSAKGVHATEQLVDEGAVHLVCPGMSFSCSAMGAAEQCLTCQCERRVGATPKHIAPPVRATEVDDDGCAVARCRFRCLQWAVLAPQNN